MSRSLLLSLALAAGTVLLRPGVAEGQGATSVRIPPLADTTRSRIVEEVTAPPGFEVTIFAAPPHLTYPTVLHPAGEGVVFAATDPNLLFGRERYLGRILRFVDDDDDGMADRYTVFADSLDAVRGIVVDGESVYAMHAPTLAVYRDTDGDGVADERRVLVDGLGFGLDDRNGDHTSNGIRLALDGWLYIAVGDYGFLNATGTDGRQIHLHRGGVLRVRPDGSELEIVARGTRNIYDLALDSHLRIFTRDNNNNGQGWNSVFHYLPVGADAGYPSLFRNFPEEIHPVLADYGAGAATTTLWVDEPGFPAPLRSGLLSADWALNRVYHHAVTPSGGTFRISQEEIMTIPRPVDLEVSPDGDLFVASLSGGSYDYAGEHVGYLLRLRPVDGVPPARLERGAGNSALLEALLAPSHARRLEAQRELLRRAPGDSRVRTRLEGALADPSLPVAARIAALFTLKQMFGADSHAAIAGAAADPSLREAALRALVDRRGELSSVPPSLYIRALEDADPLVRLQAVRGIARLAPPGAADFLMQAAADADPTVAHVARNQAAGLGADATAAALRVLDGGSPAAAQAALQVLSRLHTPVVVTELARRSDAAEPDRRVALLGALARLYHREGFWDGEWWGNQPSTEGPYFNPVEWRESPRIRSLLIEHLLRPGDEASHAALLDRLALEGVIPRKSSELLSLARRTAPGLYEPLTRLLLGGREISPPALDHLATLADASRPLHEAGVRVVVALPTPPPAASPLLAGAAADAALPAPLRAQALAALTRAAPGNPAVVAAAYASVVPALGEHDELLQAWKRYTGERARAADLEYFLGATSARGQPDSRILAYGVLVQLTALPRLDEEVRARAAGAIEAAWQDPAAAAVLARAIRLLGVEDRFGEELRGYGEGGRADRPQAQATETVSGSQRSTTSRTP